MWVTPRQMDAKFPSDSIQHCWMLLEVTLLNDAWLMLNIKEWKLVAITRWTHDGANLLFNVDFATVDLGPNRKWRGGADLDISSLLSS